MAAKKTTTKEVSIPSAETIVYSTIRMVKKDGKMKKVLGALTLPAHYKLTFGPGPQVRGTVGEQGIGNLLRIYDGKLQRGVIPNVLEFFSTDIQFSEFPDLTLEKGGNVSEDTFSTHLF